MTNAEPLRIVIAPDQTVSALLVCPIDARACLLLAHGAGAGMTHGFMDSAAAEFATHGVATLRYQFPYMERGSRRPDAPAVAHAAVRAAAASATKHAAGLPLFAGGKSFGGRMTSQAQSVAAIDGVQGLVFLGFPLHPAGKPSTDRAEHLQNVEIPMLFVQGSRDKLADMSLLRPIVGELGARATLVAVADADHAFHVPKRSGQTDAQVIVSIAETAANWMLSSSDQFR